MKKTLIVILCGILCLLIFSAAFAEIVMIDTSTSNNYDIMITYFILGEKDGDFIEAIKVYETDPELAQYADAAKYYHYMKARMALNNNELEDAAFWFNQLGSFLDSNAYYDYSEGRINEANGLFIEAITCYRSASEILSLDIFNRIENCQPFVEQEQKENDYINAVTLYEDAQKNSNVDQMTQSRNAFSLLGSYKDSEKYLSQCDEWIRALNRTITLSSELTPEGILLTWQDTDSSHGYTVSYSVDGFTVGKPEVLHESTQYLIEYILPDSVYAITLQDSDNPDVFAVTQVQTPAAEPFRSAEYIYKDAAFVGVPTVYNAVSQLSAEDIIRSNPSLLTQWQDNILSATDLYRNDLYFKIAFSSAKGTVTEHLDISFVIHSAGHGQFKSETFHYDAVRSINYFDLYVPVGSFLTAMEETFGRLQPDIYESRLYCNDMYLDSVYFTVQ